MGEAFDVLPEATVDTPPSDQGNGDSSVPSMDGPTLPGDVSTVDVVPLPDTDFPTPATCSRPLLPVSGTRVSTQRPTLQIVRGPGLRETRFDICYDRACTLVAVSQRTFSDFLMPTSNLAPGVYFWRIAAINSDGAYCLGPTWEFVVPARSSMLPRAWGTLFDVNGDGYGDLAVATEGEVRVFHGSPTGLSSSPAVVITGMRTRLGSTTLPVVPVAAGDLNGDGFVDLAIGVPAALEGQGEVWVHRGGPSGVSPMPDATLQGPDGPLGRFGFALAGVGDLEGDGYGDLVVGAPHAMTRTPGDRPGTPGRVYVFHGGSSGVQSRPLTVLTGPGGPDGYFGASVAALGDVDSNRFPDVIVGARGVGTAYVFRGTVLGLDTARFITLRDPSIEGFGAVVAGAGDVDGDNRADALIAGSEGANRVLLRTAGPMGDFAGAGVALSMSAGRFGRALASADVNADGFADVLVGAPGMGAVFVFAGAMGGIALTPSFVLRGDGIADFGAVLTSLGDVQRDGTSDLAVGGTGPGFRVVVGAPSGPMLGESVATPTAVTALGGSNGGI
jgi:hypothetical protein